MLVCFPTGCLISWGASPRGLFRYMGSKLPPVIVLLNTLADIKLRKLSYFGYMNTIITLCTSVDPDLEASPEAS